MQLPDLLDRALEGRADLARRLEEEGTDCWRIFHGAAEGREGLTIDRYGPLVLAQTFREPLSEAEASALEAHLRRALSFELLFAYNHRAKRPDESFERWHRPSEAALGDHSASEMGVRFLVRARHRGQDPWLFLDLRAGRRALRDLCEGRSVLNLFAYTCTAGVSAAAARASEVWNVDFSRSALEVGRRNAEANAIPVERLRFVQEDCLPVLRQLAGLPVKGRGGRRPHLRIEPRSFDVVFLDPPAWSAGPFGAVDVERDYPALFKPALLATAPGGIVVATNHAASVGMGAWVEILRRGAVKAGRPLDEVVTIGPEADFPSRDGCPPLKIAVCRTRP